MFVLMFDGEGKDRIYNILDIETSKAFRKDGSFCSIIRDEIKKASDKKMKIIIEPYKGQQ